MKVYYQIAAFSILFSLFIAKITATEDNQVCKRIAERYQQQNNVSVTFSNIGISHGLLVVSIKNGDGSYGTMPDRCVITVHEQCLEFFKCAGNKGKLLHAMHSENITQNYGILLIDGDSVVTSSSYLSRISSSQSILTFRPAHKCWSTAGMFWPKGHLLYEDIVKLLDTLYKSGRDDVAFQSVKHENIAELDQHYIHHSRGKDIFGKNAVRKVSISNFLVTVALCATLAISMTTSFKRTKSWRSTIKISASYTSIIFLVDYLFFLLVNALVEGKSRYSLPNDSRYVWYNSVRSTLSICWQSENSIVRRNLYGTFRVITTAQSYFLLIYLVVRDYGFSLIILAVLFKSRLKILPGFPSRERLRKPILALAQEVLFFGSFLLAIIFVFTARMYWHDFNAYYSFFKTCSVKECTVTGPLPIILSIFHQGKYFLIYFVLIVSHTARRGLYDNRRNRLISVIVLISLTYGSIIVVHPCQKHAKVDLCFNKSVLVGQNNEYSFNVELPCDLSLMDTQKFEIGPQSIRVTQTTGELVDDGWKKVAMLKALCRHPLAPSSILVYDNNVCELDSLSHSVFGGRTRKYAELVIDPHYLNKVVSYIGRFSLRRCHLINAWSRKVTHKTINNTYYDQAGLNEALGENPMFFVGRNMLSVKRTRNTHDTMAFHAVKTSMTISDLFAWGVMLYLRIARESYAISDTFIFGIMGMLAAPKGNVNRDVILRSKRSDPSLEVVSHWIDRSKKIVWENLGDATVYQDYFRVEYILGDDYQIILGYAIVFIVTSEFLVLVASIYNYYNTITFFSVIDHYLSTMRFKHRRAK